VARNNQNVTHQAVNMRLSQAGRFGNLANSRAKHALAYKFGIPDFALFGGQHDAPCVAVLPICPDVALAENRGFLIRTRKTSGRTRSIIWVLSGE
jgi:hypothetical protein